MSLKAKLVLRALIGLPLMAAILFIPAGSLRFWQGWALLSLMVVSGLVFVIYYYKRDPRFLESRLLMREKISEQKLIMKLMRLVFFSSYLLAGLDYRLGWSRLFLRPVPLWLTVLSLVLVLGSDLFLFWVFHVNRFAASIIQVGAGQAVISTGPYRIVRHPMYFGMIVMWLFIPLALGSYFAWPAFALLIPGIVWRLLNEERVLRRELPGYAEYCLRTRFRLIPFLW
jgi:protein-S-isoprenylcysteine O-methyltransferase Ste14